MASGLNGIPNRAFTRPFRQPFRIFSTHGKKRKVVLLPKSNKPPENPALYRSKDLLHIMGKIMRRVIYNGLLPSFESAKSLWQRQYGFRRAHSTMNLISTALSLAKYALNSGGFYAMLAMDIKNVFNPGNWHRIKNALADITGHKFT